MSRCGIYRHRLLPRFFRLASHHGRDQSRVLPALIWIKVRAIEIIWLVSGTSSAWELQRCGDTVPAGDGAIVMLVMSLVGLWVMS
jgi:hypothetical protein